jgi:hypothetical protein
MTEEIGANVQWTHLLEDYFSSTGEKCYALSVMHKQAEGLYSSRRNFIDLPVIVISSATGFLSVGSSSMFAGHEQIASVSLGIASLIVSVLNTVGSYFQWSKKAEGHRIASIQFGKMYRFLNIEMSLPRDQRMTPSELLKYTKETFDRLKETSPIIPPEIISHFKKQFNKPEYNDITKPEEANGLERITVYSEATSPKLSLNFSNPLRKLPDEQKNPAEPAPSADETQHTYSGSVRASPEQ